MYIVHVCMYTVYSICMYVSMHVSTLIPGIVSILFDLLITLAVLSIGTLAVGMPSSPKLERSLTAVMIIENTYITCSA